MTKEEIINYGSLCPSTKSAAKIACDLKDQQFKEYLEKKKEECNGTSRSAWEVYDEIINELFKEEQK